MCPIVIAFIYSKAMPSKAPEAGKNEILVVIEERVAEQKGA